jgi:hypothetical protein
VVDVVGAVLVAIVVFSCISARVGCASLIQCRGASGGCGLGVGDTPRGSYSSVWLVMVWVDRRSTIPVLFWVIGPS